jgi:hypothetical protein
METQKLEIKQLCSKFMLTGMAAHLEATVTEAENIVNTLKTKDFVKSQMVEYNRLLKAN